MTIFILIAGEFPSSIGGYLKLFMANSNGTPLDGKYDDLLAILPCKSSLNFCNSAKSQTLHARSCKQIHKVTGLLLTSFFFFFLARASKGFRPSQHLKNVGRVRIPSYTLHLNRLSRLSACTSLSLSTCLQARVEFAAAIQEWIDNDCDSLWSSMIFLRTLACTLKYMQ